MVTATGPGLLRPLHDLIETRPQRPETVLTLANAVTDRLGTIKAFELPPSVKKHFEAVLDAVVEQRGRAFWVQSEYGGGKTHFISALTALLAASPGPTEHNAEVWAAVNDGDVRSRAHDFTGRRILPVAISCKGILPTDGKYSRALLRLLMEGIRDALNTFGLADKIPVTNEQETVNHFLTRPSGLRSTIDAWCGQRFGTTVTALYETEGPDPAARAYLAWCREESGAEPIVDQTVFDWLTSLCRRLATNGFDGLLVVIDEFATLQNLATAPPDVAAYEDILESLGWLVPQRLSSEENNTFGVYTIVASQKAHPAKLDQRFTPLLLLAENAARDYEIIVSRRVRTLRQDRLPEIDQYYHAHKLTYDTYALMTVDRFREVFPFQPRVFEAIWSITATGEEVTAARFGIAAIWDVLQSPGILGASRLLTVSDLLRSESFREDLRATPDFRDAFAAYEAARQSAASLGLTSADHDLALRVLDALFVDHLAHRRTPRWLNTQEIAESVLATSNTAVIPPSDQVLTVLSRLRQLRQVEYKPVEGARFNPDVGTGPAPPEVVNKKKQELDDGDPRLVDAWRSLLVATAPSVGLWSYLTIDHPKAIRVLHERVQYLGTVELRNTVGTGRPLVDLSYSSGRHFHVVVLTGPATVAVEDLDDPRVAIVIPGPLNADEIDLCKLVVACQAVLDTPSLMNGPDGGALRAYAEQQKKEGALKLIGRQTQIYRRGQIVSRTGVAFNPDATFMVQNSDWQDAANTIADRLLGASYDRLDEVVQPHLFRGNSRLDPAANVGNVFACLIAGSTQGADVGAAQNFGPALGLTLPMFPNRLSLDLDHHAIAMILQRLLNAGASGLSTESFYETFSAVPFGVPHEIVTLWLLACVRAARVGSEKRHIEIQVQRNARARLRLPDNRITHLAVKDLAWQSSLRSDFLTIQVSEEVPFGAVVEYGKVFDPTLKVPTGPDQEAEEEVRLKRATDEARGQADTTATALNELATSMAQKLPDDVAATLTDLTGALSLDTEYQRDQLLNQLRQAFATPTDLRQNWARTTGWAPIVKHALELGSLQQFVQNLTTRLAENPGRYRQIVVKAGVEVAPRLSLPDLLATPTTVEATLLAGRTVREAYENEYRLHHRDYFGAATELRSKLDALRGKASILAMLNKLRCAGPAKVTNADKRIADLENRLRLCPFASRTDVNVGNGLTCQHPGCSLPGLDPLATPPAAEIEGLGRELDLAIRDRVNSVKAKAIVAVLQQSPVPSVGTFLAVIQAGQLEGLLDVLDDTLVSVIDRVLDDANVRVVPTGVIATLARRFPTFQKSQIGEVVDALRDELEREFAEKEKANPGAKVQLQLTVDRLL